MKSARLLTPRDEETRAVPSSHTRASEPVAELSAPPKTPSTRELRSRRKRDVRAKTISVKRLAKRDLELGRALNPELEGDDAVQRPSTRAECAGVPRPCPFVGCSHHLYLDVSPRTGAIKLNFPDLEPDELPPGTSCSLDVAGRGGETLENVGAILNLTRERVRQIEVNGLARLEASGVLSSLREAADGGIGKRRLPVLPRG